MSDIIIAGIIIGLYAIVLIYRNKKIDERNKRHQEAANQLMDDILKFAFPEDHD